MDRRSASWAGCNTAATTAASARTYEGKRVLVVINGTDKPVELAMAPYAEVLDGATSGRDIITDKEVIWGDKLSLVKRAVLIMEL